MPLADIVIVCGETGPFELIFDIVELLLDRGVSHGLPPLINQSERSSLCHLRCGTHQDISTLRSTLLTLLEKTPAPLGQ